MKIAIDARFLGPEGAGIGKYIDNLLANLAEIDQKNEYVVLLQKSNFHLFNPTNDNFKKILIDTHWYSVKEQFLLPFVISKEKPDLVHFPHFNVPLLFRGKFVATIHDLTLSKYGKEISQSKLYPLKRLLYSQTLKKAVYGSRKIITPSNFVRRQLMKDFKAPKEKIVVIYEAADKVFIEQGKRDLSIGEKRKVLATYGVKEPFILTVGNSYPYKNVGKVLECLTLLPQNINLVHVSKKDYFSNLLSEKSKKLGLENRFVVTGSVDSEELAILYKSAKAFVFPSLSEGFGLPGLEAVASGCPVVCSNIEVFEEVYGEAALYFNPKDPRDIEEKISLVTTNSELRTQNTRKGLEQVKKYSWKKLAQETLDVYNASV